MTKIMENRMRKASLERDNIIWSGGNKGMDVCFSPRLTESQDFILFAKVGKCDTNLLSLTRGLELFAWKCNL